MKSVGIYLGGGGMAKVYYVRRMQLNRSHVQYDTPVCGGGTRVCRFPGGRLHLLSPPSRTGGFHCKMERASHVCSKLCQVDKAVVVAPRVLSMRGHVAYAQFDGLAAHLRATQCHPQSRTL